MQTWNPVLAVGIIEALERMSPQGSNQYQYAAARQQLWCRVTALTSSEPILVTAFFGQGSVKVRKRRGEVS